MVTLTGMLNIIAAVSSNHAIGYQGRLPWHLPDDLARFRQITTGHVVVMGRRTFESIGEPLPQRANIVVSTTMTTPHPPLLVERSLPAAVRLAAIIGRRVEGVEEVLGRQGGDLDVEVFVVGGARLFEEALPLADRVYLTEVNYETPGDVFWKTDLTGFRPVSRVAGVSLGVAFVAYERTSSIGKSRPKV